MTTQRSLPNPTVWLTLQAHDAAALIDYYTTPFGFVVAARYDGDDGTVAHAELRWPEGVGGIMMGSYRPERAWCREPGSAGGYVATADPDALYRRGCGSHRPGVVARGAPRHGAGGVCGRR